MYSLLTLIRVRTRVSWICRQALKRCPPSQHLQEILVLCSTKTITAVLLDLLEIKFIHYYPGIRRLFITLLVLLLVIVYLTRSKRSPLLQMIDAEAIGLMNTK